MYSLHAHTQSQLIYIHIFSLTLNTYLKHSQFDGTRKCSILSFFGILWWQYFIFKNGSTLIAMQKKRSKKHKDFENKLRNFLISIERAQWLRRTNESSSNNNYNINNNNNKWIDIYTTHWSTQLTKSVPLGAMNLFFTDFARMRCWRHFLWSLFG